MTRILVVDDEPQILRALRINLHRPPVRRGHRRRRRRSPARAARPSRPDLVVLDLGLPDIDGVEVIRQLRTWTPVPIVVLSGRTDSHDKVDALDAGADDYVTKPFSLDELLARIRAVTRRHGDPKPRRPPSRSAGSPSTWPTAPSTPAEDPRRGRAPDPHRVAAARGPRPQPRQAGRPTPTAAGGVGTHLRQRDPLPAPVHGPPAPQARRPTRPGPGTCSPSPAWATASSPDHRSTGGTPMTLPIQEVRHAPLPR